MIHTAYTVADWTAYLTHAEIDALKALVKPLCREAQIINIGSGSGTSGLAFMEARSDVRVTTIDITLESSPFGCLAGETQVLKDAGFVNETRHAQIHGDSKVVGRTWLKDGHEPVDLVFIDGGHLYLEAAGDITIWLGNLKPDGIMAVHDFEKTSKAWAGVNEAVHDLLVGQYEQVLRVDTLIAFRNRRIEA